MIMKPAEEISYNVKSGEMKKYNAPNKNHLIPWRDNELFFNGNNLKEIGAILERMYNVNVIFEDETITKYTYTSLGEKQLTQQRTGPYHGYISGGIADVLQHDKVQQAQDGTALTA